MQIKYQGFYQLNDETHVPPAVSRMMSWMCWETSSPSWPSVIIVRILLQQREPEASHAAKAKAPRALGVLNLICPGKTRDLFFWFVFLVELGNAPSLAAAPAVTAAAHGCWGRGTHLTVHFKGFADERTRERRRIEAEIVQSFLERSPSDLFSGVWGIRLKKLLIEAP